MNVIEVTFKSLPVPPVTRSRASYMKMTTCDIAVQADLIKDADQSQTIKMSQAISGEALTSRRHEKLRSKKQLTSNVHCDLDTGASLIDAGDLPFFFSPSSHVCPPLSFFHSLSLSLQSFLLFLCARSLSI